MNASTNESNLPSPTARAVSVPGELTAEIVSRPPPPPMGAGQKSPRAWLLMSAGMLAGAACGFLGMHYATDLFVPIPHEKKWSVLVVLAAVPLLWLVAAGIHEFGHVVGGWLGGGRFLLWLVGPVMVRRTPAGIRAAWNRSVNLAGGLAACMPLDPARVTPRRTAIMTLAGPVASLLLTIGALWLAGWLATWDHPLSLPRMVAQHLALITAGLSLLVFLITIVPSTAGGFKSDGRRVFELLRGDYRSEQEAAMIGLTAAGLAGVRPADYEPALVARAVSLNDGSLFDLYGHLTVYYHAADRGKWSVAQTHLEKALAGEHKLAPFARDVVRCEYAWLLATRGTDAAAARAWLESAGNLEFEPATRLRAEAAVLLAEGKSAEARQKACEGLHALKHKTLSPVQSPFALDALSAVLQHA